MEGCIRHQFEMYSKSPEMHLKSIRRAFEINYACASHAMHWESIIHASRMTNKCIRNQFRDQLGMYYKFKRIHLEMYYAQIGNALDITFKKLLNTYLFIYLFN